MKIKSDIKIDKKIRELMSSKNFNKSFDYIEANKDKLSEIETKAYDKSLTLDESKIRLKNIL